MSNETKCKCRGANDNPIPEWKQIIQLKERVKVLEHILRDYARTFFNSDDFPCDNGYDCPIKAKCSETIVDCVSQIEKWLILQAQKEIDNGK